MSYSDNIREKTTNFPFAPENKIINTDDFKEHMKQIKSRIHIARTKLISDCTGKKKDLMNYRMLQFYVRHGMIVDKVQEIISIEQSKWLEKDIISNTIERNKAKKGFE